MDTKGKLIYKETQEYMKEIKDQIIKVRLTKSEKDKVVAYCERHDISISELLRQTLEKCFREEE